MSENEKPPEQTQEQIKQSSDTREYNFALLRKQAEAAEKDKLAAQQRATALEKELAKLTDRRAPEEDDDGDEPYVDHKKLNKKLASLEERFEKKADERAEQKARAMLDQERQNSFLKQNPDFDKILQQDIIQKFAERYPDIAEPMLEMPDNFARQKLLYQNIKALGVHKKDEEKKGIQETIDKNRKSPYYQPSGVGTAPYAGGGDFTDTGQKTAYAKMKELQARLRV